MIEPKKRDIGGNSRTFSIASAPFEDKLTFVMRLSNSPLKEELRSLPMGKPDSDQRCSGQFRFGRES